MTTYIPALTIPDQIFANTPASILTPIVLGSAVGIGVSSECLAPFDAIETNIPRYIRHDTGHVPPYSLY